MDKAKTVAFAAFLLLSCLPLAHCSGATVLSVAFLSIDGTPLAGEKVSFSAGGADSTAYTDAAGVASISLTASGEVNASVKKNDYNYLFSYNVAADGIAKNVTAALLPLLRIDRFEAAPAGEGCYKLSAKASDPRTNRPITVKMEKLMPDGSPDGAVQLSIDDNGMYVGNVCTSAETRVAVTASNAYETTTRNLTIAPAAPPPVQLPPANITNKTNETVKQPPFEPETSAPPSDVLGTAFIGIAILALAAFAAILIISRFNPGVAKYFGHTYEMMLGSLVRPINEYLRSVLGRRPPPPQVPKFGLPPQGPMMPPA